jgi:hypothetical protein
MQNCTKASLSSCASPGLTPVAASPMLSGMTIAVVLGAIVAAAVAFLAARARRPVAPADDGAAREAEAIRLAATAEADAARRQAEIDAKSATVTELERFDAESRAVEDELSSRTLDAEHRGLEIERRATDLTARADVLTARETALRERADAQRARDG